jgi:hypothetical protein
MVADPQQTKIEDEFFCYNPVSRDYRLMTYDHNPARFYSYFIHGLAHWTMHVVTTTTSA